MFLAHGSLYAIRAILDTGSGSTLIRKQLLPRGMKIPPLCEEYVQDVKELPLRVQMHLEKAQDANAEAFDRRVDEKNESLVAGD